MFSEKIIGYLILNTSLRKHRIMKTCKLCGFVFPEDNLEESIENHLQERHFIGYQDYYEIITTEIPFIGCWKCGEPRYILSPILPDIHLPCSCCMNPGNKQGIQEIRGDFFSKIRDYQGKIIKSRYYQYILALSPGQREQLLPKDIKIQSDNLLALKRTSGSRIDKSSIFTVQSVLGRSPEISARNLGALKMEVTEFKITQDGPGKWKLGDTGLTLALPEVVPFDPKHHSRGSILNPGAKRTTRRLKLSDSGDCIKFWNSPNLSVKSILFLSDSSGLPVSYQDLSVDLRWKIRAGILKTKPILVRVLEIYNEILKYTEILKDQVFLLNTVEIPGGCGPLNLKLTWGWEDYPWESLDDSYINLSIL